MNDFSTKNKKFWEYDVGVGKQGVKTKYSDNDTDSEHQGFNGKMPPPRIVSPHALAHFNFAPILLFGCVSYMETNKNEGGTCHITMIPKHQDIGRNEMLSQSGVVKIMLKAGRGRKVFRPATFANKQARADAFMLGAILSRQVEEEYAPKYCHFIVSKKDFDWLPWNYFEVLIKGSKSFAGNVFGDFIDERLGS